MCGCFFLCGVFLGGQGCCYMNVGVGPVQSAESVSELVLVS